MVIVLSAAASFLGADRAAMLFRSWPLAIFWVLLTVVGIVGFIAFPRLWRRPGLLAMHAGVVLILAGSIWSSPTGHQLAERLTGRAKPRRGWMRIYEQQASNIMAVEASSPDQPATAARLDFSLRLRSFTIERYRDTPSWNLVAMNMAAAGDEIQASMIDLPETPSRWIDLPGTGVRVRVDKYLDVHPMRIDPRVVIRLRNSGQVLGKIPAEVGAGIDLPQLGASFEIVKLFENFRIENGQAVEGPPGRYNPAAEIRADFGQGDPVTFWARRRARQDPESENPLEVYYAPAVPLDELPGAIFVELEYQGQTQMYRIDADYDAGFGEMPLAAVFDDLPAGAQGISLVLLPGQRMVKDYLADVAVLVDGEVRSQKTIEVNHPLGYGGYHFYQVDHGSDERGTYTILSVVSDNGWLAVRSGFVALLFGTFWQLWFVPVLRARKGKGVAGGA